MNRFHQVSGNLIDFVKLNIHSNCMITELTAEWLHLLDECLSYDVVTIRENAIKALPALFDTYFVHKNDEQSVIVERYVRELTTVNQIKRMGHALALGALPRFMLTPHIDFVIQALLKVMPVTSDTLKWAESRRDVIKALTRICETMEQEIGKSLTDKHLTMIYESFLKGLSEYTQDNRGDIGAWVREAAMSGLHTLTVLLAKCKSDLLKRDLIVKIIAGVAQQAVEKIDRTRALAGKIFCGFIYCDPSINNIPNCLEIREIFPAKECDVLNWFSAVVTFPKFVQLLQFSDYTYNIVLGLICSVGGLTESLVKCSSSALFDYLRGQREQNGSREILRLYEVTLQIFSDYQKNDRITVPIFRFLNKLIVSNCLRDILNDAKSELPRRTFRLIQVEIAGCRDIYKLIDGIDVLCQFIQIQGNVAEDTLVQLSILLCHRQSYVRKSTATRLYEALLIYGDNSIIPSANLDEIMNVISCTNWEQSADVLQPIRNQLCALMGVRVPKLKKTKA